MDQNIQDLINSATSATRYNNEWSAQQADIQRQFQTQSNAQAMAYSSREADKARSWEQNMANTAHQREVKDLIAAGLNPILSVNKGAPTPNSPAPSGSASAGAKGDTDTGLTNLFSGLIQAITNQATAITTTSMNNETALKTTSMSNETAIKTTQMNNQMAQIVAQIQANATLGSASIYASNNIKVQQMRQDFEEYIKQNYPQTIVGGAAAVKQKVDQGLKLIDKLVDSSFQPDAKGINYIQQMVDALFNKN